MVGDEREMLLSIVKPKEPVPAAVGAREAFAWMRAHLYGDRRLLRPTPVSIYVTGVREWRGLEDWPPPGGRESRLFLQPGEALGAATAPADAVPTRYRYDPADPTPSVGGPVLMEIQPVADNRALESRPDVVTFTGPPLATDLEAIGPVGASVWLRGSEPYFDVFVRICDVQPDGRSLNVCDAMVRVTPDDFAHGEDGTVHVEFPLWPTAHRFGAGHRIRVQVSSGAHPRYARNTGTDEPLGEASHLASADIEIFHDPAHPSAIHLPVVELDRV